MDKLGRTTARRQSKGDLTNLDIIIRTKAWSASIFLILALALVMAACSDSDSGEDATVRPTAAVTPTESSLPPTSTPAPTPIATLEPTSAPEPTLETYPLEIVDMLGRSVEIPSKPMRIVSISPTATEMLYMPLEARQSLVTQAPPFLLKLSTFRNWVEPTRLASKQLPPRGPT